jgi:hypothetical protein
LRLHFSRFFFSFLHFLRSFALFIAFLAFSTAKAQKVAQKASSFEMNLWDLRAARHL